MKVTGESTKLFRCPSGAYNDLVVETVNSNGYHCIQWDVDSIDWKAQGADNEYDRVMRKVQPGSILLFHNDGKYTPETLPRIIEDLKAKGYSFVKVGDLIYKENYYINNQGKQIKK
jgi:peptidoglycan/xylan/chitin deacetylase (PgdA/CDA1 family)